MQSASGSLFVKCDFWVCKPHSIPITGGVLDKQHEQKFIKRKKKPIFVFFLAAVVVFQMIFKRGDCIIMTLAKSVIHRVNCKLECLQTCIFRELLKKTENFFLLKNPTIVSDSITTMR